MAQPHLHTWTAAAPQHLVEQSILPADPDPKALACYGVLLRRARQDEQAQQHEEVWQRFVDGRP